MTELDRLFAALVQVLRDSRPEYLAQPFEVAELLGYVPYRTVRSAIGTETNDDYAHVVMRLLSGEEGYLVADEMLQDDMRNELSSPHPNLAVYRSYLNAHVTLSQEHARRVLERLASPTARAVVPATPDVAPVVTSQAESELIALGAALAARAAHALGAATAVVTPRAHTQPRPSCKQCGHILPEGRDAHFCPNCGQHVPAHRCAGCRRELEAGWKFCITCGRSST